MENKRVENKRPRSGAYGGTRTGAGSPVGDGGRDPLGASVTEATDMRVLWFSYQPGVT